MTNIPDFPELHESRLSSDSASEPRRWPALLNASSSGTATIPAGVRKRSSWWKRLRTFWKPRSVLDLAPYRRLALQLHYDLPRGSSPRSVLLVTPGPSAFLPSASAEIARALAEELQRPVVLVDANLSSPALSRSLGCASEQGFADWLGVASRPVDDFALGTSHSDLSFLPAGLPNESPLPASPEVIAAGLRTLEARWDFALLSGGSVLRDAAALAIARHVGCVLMVVEENLTSREEMEAARQALLLCKVEKVGVILAKTHPPSAWHRGGVQD